LTDVLISDAGIEIREGDATDLCLTLSIEGWDKRSRTHSALSRLQPRIALLDLHKSGWPLDKQCGLPASLYKMVFRATNVIPHVPGRAVARCNCRYCCCSYRCHCHYQEVSKRLSAAVVAAIVLQLPLLSLPKRLSAAIVATFVAVTAAIAIAKKYPSGCPLQLSLL